MTTTGISDEQFLEEWKAGGYWKFVCGECDKPTVATTVPTILDEAKAIVGGPRADTYGHPADNFKRIGTIWGALLDEWRKGDQAEVPPELVGLMMTGLKLARNIATPKRDNLVDGAGYLYAIERLAEREQA